MSTDLEVLTDEFVYRMMHDAQPSLVAAVEALLKAGQTPAQIEARMSRRIGNVQTVRNVRHVAEHLDRNRPSFDQGLEGPK